MSKFLFIICFLSLFFCLFSVVAQTEVTYPALPNVDTPQDIELDNVPKGEAFSLFMAYTFRLVLYVCFAVSAIIVFYGGILYFVSGDDSEKKKNARGWIIGAFQGTFIILLSHLLLSTIDSRFIIFNLREIDRDHGLYEEGVVLEWEIKDFLFQIPFGLLLEEAGTNEIARDKLYDILDAIYDAEDSADAIVWGGKDLLEIIDTCPVGNPCCSTHSIPPWPPIPFDSIRREKEIRNNFRCWWNNYAQRKNSPTVVPKPSLKTLVTDMFDSSALFLSHGITDIEEGKERMYIVTRALRNVGDDYFEENMLIEHPLWKVKESFFNIIEKLEKIALYQDNIYDFTNEAMKVAKEMQELTEEFPLLLKSPFKDSVSKLISQWDYDNVLAKKSIGGVDTPYVDQMDISWRHIKYGNASLGTAGCLLASTVMVMQNLGYDVSIFDAKEFALRNGHDGELGGTEMPFAVHFPESYGLNAELIRAPGPGHLETMINWAENKGSFVVTGRDLPWCMPGGYHALVVAGVDRQRELFYLSNTSAPFAHTATFNEVRNSMPTEVVYIHKGEGSLLQKKARRSVVLGGCGSCPIINPPIQIKIAEIIKYMMRHYLGDLYSAFFLKDVLKEDMYQLYKALMLQSLGMHDMISYTNLLLEKIEREREKGISLDTDIDFTKIHRLYGDKNNPYIWNWEKWLSNITYKTEAVIDGRCEIIEENDPLTFYLERPNANKAISDAIFKMAFKNKQLDLQHLEDASFINEEPVSFYKKIEEERKTINDYFRDVFGSFVFANTSSVEIQECLNNLGVDLENISTEELYSALRSCGIDVDQYLQKIDSDHFTCGMEIPVGETFELIWQHFRKILFAIDGYLEEGVLLLDLQKTMNQLAAGCECPCVGCGLTCGGCVLTCDKGQILAVYGQILSQRAKMASIANYIKHLTSGFFTDPSEDVCHYLSEDIRSEKEKKECSTGKKTYITKHELITRKLNYSRVEFNSCFIHPEHKDSVSLTGEGSKTIVFGPIAEQKMLHRYTKTVQNNTVLNTHTFNWFCCLGKTEE